MLWLLFWAAIAAVALIAAKQAEMHERTRTTGPIITPPPVPEPLLPPPSATTPTNIAQ